MGRFLDFLKWALPIERRAGRSRTKTSPASKRHRRLFLEALEAKAMLSVSAVTAASGSGGSTTPAGLTPNQIRGAYGLGSYTSGVLANGISFAATPVSGIVQGDGRGQTIAIVDAYDYPTALSDLNAFSTYYGLPAFNGAGEPTFEKLNQTGGSLLPGTDPTGPSNSDWEGEEALDIEWAHAMAPMANIILFEAANDSGNGTDLLVAAQTAAKTPGVVAVSMSWTFDESSFTASEVAHYDTTIFTTPSGHVGGSATLGGAGLPGGVTFLAASGDNGPYEGDGTTTISPQYPATSPNVVAVGGTSLTVAGSNPNYSYGGEVAWGSGVRSAKNGGGGSGISSDESQPSYQSGVVSAFSSTRRTYPDVSADADPNTGVPVYDAYDDGAATPWSNYNGGTSLACPMWAGLIAIADEGRAIAGLGSLDGRTQTLPELYALPAADFHDITTGSTGVSPEYAAGTGYDLATGIGSPVANLLIPGLVGYQPTVSGISPATGSTAGGTSVVITGTDFTGATVVDFGTTPATSVVVNSATQITVTSPVTTAAGAVNVTVTGPGGKSAVSAGDKFTYTAGPTVTGVSPDVGLLAGGTPVTITGTGFTAATAVDFGGLPAGSFTVNSATQITATSPVTTTAGAVDVTVTAPSGTSGASAADQFTYSGWSIVGLTSSGAWWMAQSTGSSFANQYWDSWSPSLGWQYVQVGDFTGNGRDDIVGMTSSGEWYVALNTGTSFVNQAWGSWSPSAGWQYVHVADVTGDGKADIVGMTSTGAWYAAVSNGTSFTTQYWGSWNPSAGWQDVQVANITGSGMAGIVGMTASGAWYAAVSNGTSFTTSYWGAWSPAVTWSNVQVGDFTGDGMADIVGETSYGAWYVGLSNGLSFTTTYWGSWDPSAGWQDVQVADVTGNGVAGIVGMTASGAWCVAVSNGTSFTTTSWGAWNPGAGWQFVQAADVTGDGKADIIGMTSAGNWYVSVSNGTSFTTSYWDSWNPSGGWQPVLVGQFA
jgi:hypothetical protein